MTILMNDDDLMMNDDDLLCEDKFDRITSKLQFVYHYLWLLCDDGGRNANIQFSIL